MYAEVIIEISHEKVDRPFEYRIPQHLEGVLKVGDRVMVPFGRGDTLRGGYCIGIKDKADYDESKLKDISSVDESGMSIEGCQIALAWWMKAHFGGTMIQALKTVIPARKKLQQKTRKKVDRLIDRENLELVIQECERKKQTARLRVLRALLTDATLPYELVRDKLGVTSQTIKALESKGYIKLTETEYYRNPVVMDKADKDEYELSDRQKLIVDTVAGDHRAGTAGRYLIHGITGSGKTAVYIGISQRIVEQGYQAIVLIPEISLTYQTLLRFYKTFGDRVSVVNSSMTDGERYDQYLRAKRGDIDVIIGPRSALFTPFERLGVIIIDEEHETSYKSETTPRYSTRECAEYISESRGVSLVLGSATPSLDAYYKAQTGAYTLFTLEERLSGGRLPGVEIVDLREELRAGNKSIFSVRLQELLQDRLSRHEQSMLFINRRGVSGFVSCRSCGHIMKCPHCDVSMSEHRGGRLLCHYCGHSEAMPRLCPECGSKYIAGFKAGTEQIETEVRRMFPTAGVLRMDADTTREKGSMETILRAFKDHEADILIGTQMIVKGHDFPLVTLVGILAADMSLGVGDYRAAERTFDLLTQAAGRAGRGAIEGDVIIQTYQPEHYSIVASAAHDYRAFYDEEIAYRRLALYPPIWHMLAVLTVSEDEKSASDLAERYHLRAEGYLTDHSRGYQIGPAPAGIAKIKDKYRYVLYVKHRDMEELVRIKDALEDEARTDPASRALTFFDFDPVNAI